MTKLEQFLQDSIIGQDHVLEEIATLIECALKGMRYPEQPIASILSLGPTGVGKTETVLLASNYCFGPGHLARFDMSEYMTEATIDKLLGGRHQGVFEALYDQTRGTGVILFDEIEKAHTLILNVFLQILSAGRITLAGGKTLDLTNYVVFATSNIGGRQLMASTSDHHLNREEAIDAALNVLLPEIMGRFDLLAGYSKLSDQSKKVITRIHVANCIMIFSQLGYPLGITQRAIDYIESEGYTERFGARPIRRKAMDIISRAVNDSGLTKGTVDYDVTTGRCELKV